MYLKHFIQRQSALAVAYAGDGAMHTAARILRQTADVVDKRVQETDAFLYQMIARGHVDPDPVNLQGSGPEPIEPRIEHPLVGDEDEEVSHG